MASFIIGERCCSLRRIVPKRRKDKHFYLGFHYAVYDSVFLSDRTSTFPVPVLGCSAISFNSFASFGMAYGAFCFNFFRSFFASSEKTIAYISVFSNQSSKKITHTFSGIHPVNLAGLILLYSFSDFCIEADRIDKSIIKIGRAHV